MEQKKRNVLKDLFFLFGGITTLDSGVAGFIYLKDLYREGHIKETTAVVDSRLNETLDSVVHAKASKIVHQEIEVYLSNRPDGFRTVLSRVSDVDKQELVDIMGNLIKWNKDNKIVGLRVYRGGEVKYIHVDGSLYRAFKDSSGGYYFINNKGDKQWTY